MKKKLPMILAVLLMTMTVAGGQSGAQDSSILRESVQQTVGEDGKIDLNKATVQELESITGIGPVLAQRIVEYRRQNGSFASIEDLLSVAGIGSVKLQSLKDFLFLSPAN